MYYNILFIAVWDPISLCWSWAKYTTTCVHITINYGFRLIERVVVSEVYAKWESKNELLSNITHTQWNHMQCMCRCRYHWCPPYLLHPGDIPACWYSQRNPMTRRFRRRSPLNSHTGTLSECSSLHPTYTWNSRSDRAEMKTNTHITSIIIS